MAADVHAIVRYKTVHEMKRNSFKVTIWNVIADQTLFFKLASLTLLRYYSTFGVKEKICYFSVHCLSICSNMLLVMFLLFY